MFCTLLNCRSFLADNRFAHIDDGPIQQKTIVELHPQTGEVINQWADKLYVSPLYRTWMMLASRVLHAVL